MHTAAEFSRDDWDHLLAASFCVYAIVTVGGATEADARRLRDEVSAAPSTFAEGTVGHALTVALGANLDTLWAAHQAAGRDPRKGIERAMKVLRRCSPEEQVAVRGWLLALGVRVAAASRVVGEPAFSDAELESIGELAGLLRMPLPDLASDRSPG